MAYKFVSDSTKYDRMARSEEKPRKVPAYKLKNTCRNRFFVLFLQFENRPDKIVLKYKTNKP